MEATVPAAKLEHCRQHACRYRRRMLYMVVEQFKDAPAIYQRLREKGRMMPEGLEYVSSWIDDDLKTCWQLMRTEDESLLRVWTDNWRDLMDFEIVSVRTTAEVREIMEKQL